MEVLDDPLEVWVGWGRGDEVPGIWICHHAGVLPRLPEVVNCVFGLEALPSVVVIGHELRHGDGS